MSEKPVQPTDISKELGEIAQRSQHLVQEFLEKSAKQGPQLSADLDSQFDPAGIGRAFIDMTQRMLSNPSKLVEAQTDLWQSYMKLWENTSRRMMGQEVEPVAEPARGDKRFSDTEWSENFIFDYIKQSYLLAAQWMQARAR